MEKNTWIPLHPRRNGPKRKVRFSEIPRCTQIHIDMSRQSKVEEDGDMDLEAHVPWSIVLLGVRSTEVCFPSLQTDLNEHGFKEQISTIQMEGTRLVH